MPIDPPFEIWLVHPEQDACDAFAARFEGLPKVRMVRATYPHLQPHDCFVTAGNSFGIMTAGIDAAVVYFLWPEPDGTGPAPHHG